MQRTPVVLVLVLLLQSLHVLAFPVEATATGSPEPAVVALPTAQPAPDRALPAEPYLPPSHWSRSALRRLAAVGLLEPGAVAVAWPMRRSRMRRLLREAVAAEGTDGSGLAAGFLGRFEDEFPRSTMRRDPGGDAGADVGRWTPHAGGRLDVGWGGSRGLLLGGAHIPTEDGSWSYQGPVSMAPASSLLLHPTLDLALGSSVSFSASVQAGGRNGGIRAEQVYAAARHRALEVWAGRRAFSSGPGVPETIVLSDRVLFHGFGLELPDGVGLPGFLGALGAVRGATLFSRLERSGDVGRPWFWAARVGLSPRSDLSIGLNRATIFGGEGNEPVTFRNVALMLLGFTQTGSKSSDFENQVASVDVLWRTGPRGFPVLIRGEWGFADVGGAWFRVPGIVGAVEVPVVPGLEGVAFGIEHASFSGSEAGHPPWYRHGALGEGWTDRGRLLGHPMGGHGTEWAGHFRWDRPDHRGRHAGPSGGSGPEPSVAERPSTGPGVEEVSGRLFRRDRGHENLLADERTGPSLGGALRMLASGGGRVRLEAEVEWERGRSGWRSWTAVVSVGTRF